MADHISGEPASIVRDDCNITAQAGYYAVNFVLPHNAIHQITGFKSEHDAKTWVAEVKHLVRTDR